MRFSLALVFLFAASLTHSASILCPDGLTYGIDSITDCAINITAPGVASITDGSGIISATADAQAATPGTAYQWTSNSTHPPGCTAANYTYAALTDALLTTRQTAIKARQKCMNWKTMVAGTGSVDSGSATASEGLFSIVVDSEAINPTTKYYTQLFVLGGAAGDEKMSAMETVEWTTTAPTPGTVLSGLQRYIKDDGNNNNDGLSDDQARLTLALGCPSSLTAGTDCNLKTGDTWTERMVVGHAGLSTDWAVVRCYKMSGGDPYACESGDTKPIIQGPMDQAKLTAGTEDYSNQKYNDEGTTINTGLYEVPQTGDYTEHQNLQIQNGRGRGFKFDGGSNVSTAGEVGGLHHIKVVGVKVINFARNPLMVLRDVSDVVIRDSEFSHTTTCDMQRNMGDLSIKTESCANAGWSGGVHMSNGTKRVLVENNDIQKGIDEGAKVLLDGRNASIAGYEKGNFLNPTILENFRRGDVRFWNHHELGERQPEYEPKRKF